jgi:hypothetical protein
MLSPSTATDKEMHLFPFYNHEKNDDNDHDDNKMMMREFRINALAMHSK